MTAKIIDGKGIAANLRGKVADAVHRLARDRGITPGLAVVLVGNNPASESYVGSKMKMTVGSGMRSFDHRLPATASESELLALIARLNADPTVHGILVQLPLPAQIDPQNIIAAIDPAKDVDGFHPMNAGRLSAGLPALAPCTPIGCVLLAKTVQPSLAGLEAVVIGRSNIVGKPLAQLLLAENATVTVAHSKTRDLPAVCRRGDVLFAAVGRAEMVRRDWVKPGATVIDVGINRVRQEGGKSRIVGDVAFAEVTEIAGAITPVPGGVGPMTIACLLANTVRAACAIAGLRAPALGQGPTDDRRRGNGGEEVGTPTDSDGGRLSYLDVAAPPALSHFRRRRPCRERGCRAVRKSAPRPAAEGAMKPLRARYPTTPHHHALQAALDQVPARRRAACGQSRGPGIPDADRARRSHRRSRGCAHGCGRNWHNRPRYRRTQAPRCGCPCAPRCPTIAGRAG